ncbi:LysR substrate-binding domain-containing protein [Streptomyces hirsutus]|uniref:LysR substrate-binding domain-containing protein n=1 Tax=Streptomyces hirsutus TaxID=35620 RepID=UPI003F4DCA54
MRGSPPRLERGSRGVTLTEAGAVPLREVREVRVALDAVEAAERRTRRAAPAATGRPAVVLAAKAGASGELLAKLLDAYAAEPGAIAVDVVLCGPGEQARVLRDGRADVALLHRPFDDTAGFDTENMHTEGQVAILPVGHSLSARPHLRLAEVTDLSLPHWPRPDGTFPNGPGPQVRDHTRLSQLIALGRACVVVPESGRTGLRKGLTAVPVLDAPTSPRPSPGPPHSRLTAVAALVRAATPPVPHGGERRAQRDRAPGRSLSDRRSQCGQGEKRTVAEPGKGPREPTPPWSEAGWSRRCGGTAPNTHQRGAMHRV